MNMSLLESLYLVGNNLSTCEESLPFKVFDGLEGLKVLSLRPQPLHDCPSYPLVFGHTPKLEHLSLTITTKEYSDLPPVTNELASLRHLHTLDFVSNSNLRTFSFKELRDSNIKAIFLRDTLWQVQNGSLKNIPTLEILAIRPGTLSSIINSLQDLGSTPLKDLILNMYEITSSSELSKDLFCNSLGRLLRRMSFVHLRVADRFELDFLYCLTSLREITFMYCKVPEIIDFPLSRNGIQGVATAVYQILLKFKQIETVSIHHLGSSSEEFRTRYMSYNPTYNDGCIQGIETFFARKNYKHRTIIPTKPQNREHFIYFWFPPTLRYVQFSESPLPCGNIYTKDHFSLNNDNNVQVVDAQKMPILCNTGWMNTYSVTIAGLFQLQYLDISWNGLRSLPRLLDVYNLRVLNASHNRLGDLTYKGWRIQMEFFLRRPCRNWICQATCCRYSQLMHLFTYLLWRILT